MGSQKTAVVQFVLLRQRLQHSPCDSGTFLPLRVVVLSVPMVSPPPQSRPALAAHCPGAGSGGGSMSPRQPELGPILRGKQSFVRRHPTLYGQHVSKSTKRQIERCQRD